ncbi:DUF192 domain-containing protein [Novosphingobium olei]|uniref:DUF192 domain-containing protein n=1 Tax=Novosphingobium olei TaxID=2728851 RepID=A0A7Y0BKT7_9SPHN|nr:DUF192 domain-containing protein [Novosphingobium olei]NML92307.1 DUF192 domain-containing protein [Novosphingobium olei]BEV01830.1 DUF192 domain-containing protein [Novosphingobium olei]
MKISTRFVSLALVAGIAGALAACSPADARQGAAKAVAAAPASAPDGATQKVSAAGLKVIPLTAVTAAGRHAFTVEVAETLPQQERGLMFRKVMGADEGMIFPYDPPQRVAFWMKNTILPLDIIFIGPDHRVINIAADAVPYDLTPLPADAPAAAVLELNAGRAKELGIGPGTLVEW